MNVTLSPAIPADDLCSDRRRFNSGYWDGYQAARNDWSPQWAPGMHPWPVYEAAYWIGIAEFEKHRDSNTEPATSTAAWERFIEAQQSSADLVELV